MIGSDKYCGPHIAAAAVDAVALADNANIHHNCSFRQRHDDIYDKYNCNKFIYGRPIRTNAYHH